MTYTQNGILRWVLFGGAILCTLVACAEARAAGFGFAATGVWVAFALLHVAHVRQDPQTPFHLVRWAIFGGAVLTTLAAGVEPRSAGAGFGAAGMWVAFALLHVEHLRQNPPTDYRLPPPSFPVGAPPAEPREGLETRPAEPQE